MANKTTISVTKPTPMWATWTFRIVLILTTAATMVIASDPAIDDAIKVRVGVYLKGLDFLVWGFSRMLGVDVEESKWKPK